MPRKRRSRLLLPLSLLFVGLIDSSAFAQNANRTLAEHLYQVGRELFEAGKYEEACPKFAESNRLEPGAGTQLNLAACYEKLGKLATAWSEYETAEQMLIKSNDSRAEYARQKASELRARLSFVTIRVPPEVRVPGMRVTLDGVELGAAVWNVPAPVDSGEHQLRVEAPEHVAWTRIVAVTEKPEQHTVVIPQLEKASAATPPKEETPQRRVSPTKEKEPTPKEPAPGEPEADFWTTPVIVSGAATLVMGGVFVGSGLAFLSAKDDFEQANGDPAREKDAEDSQRSWMLVNTIAVAGTLVGAGFTTYFLLDTSSKEQAPSATLSPWLDTHGGGAMLHGRF